MSHETSHLRPIDGDGTGGEPPVTDAETHAAVAAYVVREGIDRLAVHLYAFVTLAALVVAVYVAFGLPATLLATVILGALAAATVSAL